MIAMLVFAGSAVAQVVNGGFETGNFAGWTQVGNAGATGVAGNWAGFAPNSGNYQGFFGAVGSIGGIQQTINTVAGHDYTLSFYLGHTGGTPNEIEVSFGGVNLISATNVGGFAYTQYTFSGDFGDNAVLSFQFREDPAYFLLDDVSVTETPEPGSLALLGSGLIGLGGAVRRKLIAR